MAGTDDSMQAKMLMLRGLNYTAPEIAAELPVSESTVYKYLNHHEDAAKAADDWETYYWRTVTAALYDEEFRDMLAGYLTDADE